jgi:hypothetical protein
MTEQNRVLTFEWLKNLVMVLTILGTGVGVYVNLTNRVTAAEAKLEQLEEVVNDYKGVHATLARIEEQINGVRKDTARIEARIK